MADFHGAMEAVAHSLFSLGHPWWELLLRAVAVYVAVLVMVRIVGKRTVGQYTPFDLIVVVLLGTAVQNSLVGRDVSLVGGLLIAATLLALNWVVGFFSARSLLFDTIVEGRPVVLARHGELYPDALRQQSVSQRDFDVAMRAADCREVSEVDLALLETSGHISILKKSA